MKLLLCSTDVGPEEYRADFEKYVDFDEKTIASYFKSLSSDEPQHVVWTLNVIGEIKSPKFKKFLMESAQRDGEFLDFFEAVRPGKFTYKQVKGVRFYLPEDFDNVWSLQGNYLLSRVINSNPALAEFWDESDLFSSGFCFIFTEEKVGE